MIHKQFRCRRIALSVMFDIWAKGESREWSLVAAELMTISEELLALASKKHSSTSILCQQYLKKNIRYENCGAYVVLTLESNG